MGAPAANGVAPTPAHPPASALGAAAVPASAAGSPAPAPVSAAAAAPAVGAAASAAAPPAAGAGAGAGAAGISEPSATAPQPDGSVQLVLKKGVQVDCLDLSNHVSAASFWASVCSAAALRSSVEVVVWCDV